MRSANCSVDVAAAPWDWEGGGRRGAVTILGKLILEASLLRAALIAGRAPIPAGLHRSTASHSLSVLSPQSGEIGEAAPGRQYPPPARGEPAWPAWVTVLSAIALQLLLPDRLTPGPKGLLAAMEGLLLIGLALATPRTLEGVHPVRRRLALGLTGLVSAANIASLALLAHQLIHHGTPNGRELIGAGVLIWLTNVLIFSLWFWETDRGGPGKRAAAQDEAPDFLFPQMSDDRIEPEHWRPQFIDYLYVSLTNATAFSPTDTMPLSPRAKIVMGIQSLVSLVTLGLIVSRAVNILQ